MNRSVLGKGVGIIFALCVLYPSVCFSRDMKISDAILAHRKAKIRRPGVSAGAHAGKLRGMGLNPKNLSGEDCALYVKQRLRPNEIARLRKSGVAVHETYVPPVPGKHENGFHLATVSYSALDFLRQDGRFVRLESTEFSNKPSNDLAAQQTNVDLVHAGTGITARTGAGVKMAIADSGLDLTHGDIPAPAEAYDMTDGTGPGSWGTDVANTVTDHGTHVTGSAVGSGALSGGKYAGAAPGAVLYFYKIGQDDTGSAYDTDMIEAINRAVAVGCSVFSMSYGGTSTFMDGSGSVCQAIDAAEAAGTTCFISAGNEQDNGQHYSIEVPPAATSAPFQFTISNASSTVYKSQELVWAIWIDGQSDDNIALTCSNLEAGESLVAYSSDASSRGTEGKKYVLTPSVARFSSKTYDLSLTNSAIGGGAARVHLYHVAGEGAFDAADPSYTITYPAVADTAIAVGAWTHRRNWTNYEGDGYYYPSLTVGTLAWFSSLGPRLDGLMKPDIVAPGAAMISARDSGPDLASSDPLIIDNDGANLNGSGPADYYVNLGTSMASPHAAGLAALVLEANPSMTPAELRQRLTSTASAAHSPDNSVGYGLLDALAAVETDDPPTILPTAIKGVSYTAWDSTAFSTASSDASIEAAFEDGCNWIALCVWEFQDSPASTIIAPDYSSYSATPESVADAIKRCRELGLNVMLKPMIDCKSCSWRGEIQPSADWFAAYEDFIDRWAQIAQDNSVEMFCVGCELQNTTSWSASWRSVVDSARLIYSGPVVYAANHGNEENIDWWDALDHIGIDAYYSLTSENDPTPDQLASAWGSRLDSIESWRNANWPSMDVLFTEVGYQSLDGTNKTPWETDPDSNPLDFLEQADCYEALFNQCRQRDWWLGAFWWNWETDPNAGGLTDPTWTPQNKPAEVILQDYYTGKWRWNDGFVAAFVDAEGIDRHVSSTGPGEKFEGQVLSVTDVAGAGVDIVYSLVDDLANPVDNSVAGLEAFKPDGANWLGRGPTSGLREAEQWATTLNMDASPFEIIEIPLSYISGAGALDVRAFCVTGTAGGPWVETQLDSQAVTLVEGQSTVLTIDLTAAPNITRMAKVGVVVEAHDSVMEGQQATLRIGAVTDQMTVVLANYGAGSGYRWKDVAGLLYSNAYQSSYTYDEADVQVSFNTLGTELGGVLDASNLKPNFAYQFRLTGSPIHQLGDTNYGSNELIGMDGRWLEQEWLGSSWSGGADLNDKGDGSSPNPNDQTYLAGRDIADDLGGSPTGLKYKYGGYRVFDYFITDEFGNATVNFSVDSSYHVLWGTSQRSPATGDGPLISHSFDVDPAVHSAYDTDYGPVSESVFGEWERLPADGTGMREGSYRCDFLLTEESFHESGLGGNWANAMHGEAEFEIVSSGILLDEDFDDGDYAGWTIVDEGTLLAPSEWSVASGTMIQNSDIYSNPTSIGELSKVGTYAYYSGGMGWASYQADLTIVTEDDNDDIGVMFRYQDSDNYYRFSWGRQRSYRRLVKKKDGVFNLLDEDSVPYVAGQTYQVRIVTQGPSLQVLIDGSLVLSATDGDLSTGSIALYTWGNTGSGFDDIIVEPLEGGNLPPAILSVSAAPSAILDTQTSQLQIVANDPDSGPNPLSYNWIVPPGAGSLDDAAIANPVYTPPDVAITQVFTLTVEVSDGQDVRSDTVDVAVTDADSPVLLNDNFDDGDYAGWTIVDEGTVLAPSDWSAASGTMIQNSDIYSNPTSAAELSKVGTYAYYFDGLAWANYQADLTIQTESDNDDIGVMFRYQDSDNYYRFSWGRQRSYRRLVKKQDGIFTLLDEDPVPYVAGQTYQVRIIAQGTLLQVSVDGSTVLSAADGDLSTGSIALYTWANTGSRFDDVVVEPLSGGNLPPAVSSVSAAPSAILDTQTSQLQVIAADPDSGPDPLSYNWIVPPGGGSLDDATIANPVYTPPDVATTQTFTLTVEVSDGEDVTSDAVAVTVTDADSPALLNDNFDDGDYSGWTIIDEGTADAPSAWSAASGVMVQNSNIYSAADIAALGTYAYYSAGLSWANYQADLTIRSDDDDAIGVMFRYQNNDNYYRFSWDKSRKYRRLVKKQGGVFSVLDEDSAPYAIGQTYQLRIVASGNLLQVNVDGEPIFSVTDSSLTTGSIAFYTWGNEGGYFDDVVVEPLSGGNLPPNISALTATPSTVFDDQTSQLQVVADDPDSGPEPLSYNWIVQPGEGTLDNAAAENPVYTPPDVSGTQMFTVTVEVSDGNAVTVGSVGVTILDVDSPVLLDDNFDDGDYSGWLIVDEGTNYAPSAWSAGSGVMVQSSNIYGGSTSDGEVPKPGTYAYYSGGSGWTDCRIDMTIRSADDDAIGVMFRYQDSENYYRFSWDRSRSYRRLVKKEAGLFSVLAADSTPYNIGQTYQLRIEAQGSSLVVSIDGTGVFSVTDSALSSGTIGLYTWGNAGSYFDDASVEQF